MGRNNTPIQHFLKKMHKFLPTYFLSLLTILLLHCSPTNGDELPEPNLEIDELTVYQENAPIVKIFHLEYEMAYGVKKDLQIGMVGGIAVDKNGNVFINDFQQRSLFVFDTDGNLNTQIGKEGDGPGEFRVGPLPFIHLSQLYAIDMMSLRLSIFSTESLELVRESSLNPVNKSQFDELEGSQLRQIYPGIGGNILVSFAQHLATPPTTPGIKIDGFYFRYYLMNKEGRIVSSQLFKHEQPPYLTGSVDGQVHVATEFQLFSKPLIAVSPDGNIYSSMSGDFLIKKYNSDGEYSESFYHPFDKVAMTREDALGIQKTEFLKEIVRQNDLPETWPALDDMLIDDENRLWISTIVDDFDIYEWWVLKETGELITRFEWPRDEPIEVVKNGYMYTRQTDDETGLQQVVRYKFEMIKK